MTEAIRAINVREAAVRTATVEVKTLTVSGKQVTLAVFRQLEHASLIDSQTGQFRGLPWGRVNYHPDKCGDRVQHHHVVWQEGERLKRDAVYPEAARVCAPLRRLDSDMEDVVEVLALLLGGAVKPEGLPEYASVSKTYFLKWPAYSLNVGAAMVTLLVARWKTQAVRDDRARHVEARDFLNTLREHGIAWEHAGHYKPPVLRFPEGVSEQDAAIWRSRLQEVQHGEGAYDAYEVSGLLEERGVAQEALHALRAAALSGAQTWDIDEPFVPDAHERVWGVYVGLRDRRDALLAAINQRLTEIAALDQLFIAV